MTAKSDGHGLGSEFTITLPILSETTSPQAAPVKDTLQPPTFRILIVDDNPDSTASLSMLLDLMGHETTTAGDGLQAISAAETFLPEVVLLDIGLPKLNGYEACRRIREQPWGKGMVLVAVTARQTPERLRTFIETESPPGKVLLDADGSVQRAAGVQDLPAHLLLGPDGTIFFRAGALAEGVVPEVERRLGLRRRG